jgi:CheY-like chemotaxis protein
VDDTLDSKNTLVPRALMPRRLAAGIARRMFLLPHHELLKRQKYAILYFMEKRTVLVIEDSPQLAESLADMLAMKDLEAIIAQNGMEGISLALELKPNLILLDIRLPDIDGYAVYRQIRKDAWGAKVKIIIITASESIEVISKNINLPPNYILFKPDWSVNDLLNRIEQELND